MDLVEWLGLPEAPHRGYDSARELFEGVRPGDEVAAEVGRRLDDLDARLRPDLVLGPQGVGNHADHLQVIRALLARPGMGGRLAWYRDLPYAAKFPEARPSPALPTGLVETAVCLGPSDLEAKLEGCAAYSTQLPFQFGGEAAMRRLLADFAEDEGGRLGLGRPAEAILVPPGLAAKLAGIGSPDRTNMEGVPSGARPTTPTGRDLQMRGERSEVGGTMPRIHDRVVLAWLNADCRVLSPHSPPAPGRSGGPRSARHHPTCFLAFDHGRSGGAGGQRGTTRTPERTSCGPRVG